MLGLDQRRSRSSAMLRTPRTHLERSLRTDPTACEDRPTNEKQACHGQDGFWKPSDGNRGLAESREKRRRLLQTAPLRPHRKGGFRPPSIEIEIGHHLPDNGAVDRFLL